jgi:starvation-inducible DNA-binding protein
MTATADTPEYTTPGLDPGTASKIIEVLQDRLIATLDLHLTLKHIHWNVVGPTFIAVHEMIDTQVDAAREMADEVAERITTLGGSPDGTPGAVVRGRRWEDYALGRDTAQRHLAALDAVYSGVVEDHRRAVSDTEDLDPVTEDLLIDHLRDLEKYHWFVRAHLEDPSGVVHDPRRESA